MARSTEMQLVTMYVPVTYGSVRIHSSAPRLLRRDVLRIAVKLWKRRR